jgi:hypothetical protein
MIEIILFRRFSAIVASNIDGEAAIVLRGGGGKPEAKGEAERGEEPGGVIGFVEIGDIFEFGATFGLKEEGGEARIGGGGKPLLRASGGKVGPE